MQPTQQGRAQVAAVQSAGGGWGETAAISQLALGQTGLNQGLQVGWQRRSSQQGGGISQGATLPWAQKKRPLGAAVAGIT